LPFDELVSRCFFEAGHHYYHVRKTAINSPLVFIIIDHLLLTVKSLKCVCSLANENFSWIADAVMASVEAGMFGKQDLYSLSAGLSLR
jgi:hypothetical protein